MELQFNKSAEAYDQALRSKDAKEISKVVEDDEELVAISKVFEQMLDDVDLEM